MTDDSKIYTRAGDDGTTSLGDASRVEKTDARIDAYSSVDETNSAIGLALSLLSVSGDIPKRVQLDETLRGLQHELFDLGADLARPLARDEEFDRVSQVWVEKLEAKIDDYQTGLPELRSFILPGGTSTAAALHLARTAARRAERATWAAVEVHGSDLPGGINSLTAKYLNRLSDLLFVLARVANDGNDVLWVKHESR